MTEALTHFCNLVIAGKADGSSPSEHNARWIAAAVCIQGRIATLDDLAIDGLHEFIDLCKAHPEGSSELLRIDKVFCGGQTAS
jgi:hypothetical protein